MLRVCVVGSGRAGQEAAREAAGLDASVTVLDTSADLGETGGFEGLSSNAPTSEVDRAGFPSSGIDFDSRRKVLAVEEGGSVLSPEGKTSYDSVVIATGSELRFPHLQGWRKQRVYPLDSFEAYSTLREDLSGMDVIGVVGSSPGALIVSDRLADAGKAVSLFMGERELVCPFGAEVTEEVLSAARRAGVATYDGLPEAIVGTPAPEALLYSGLVVPCDGVVLVAAASPSLPNVSTSVGKRGGVIVDRMMRSSAPKVLAAGDCAEFRVRTATFPMMCASTAAASGRVAGANAAGREVQLPVVQNHELSLFDINAVSAGMTLKESEEAGIEAREVSHRDARGLCTVVFEKESGLVIGVQLAGSGLHDFALALLLLVSRGPRLEDLVYQRGAGSTDISLVSKTAREGMKLCRESSSATRSNWTD